MKDLKDMSLQELWELFRITLKEHNRAYTTWYNEEKESLERLLKEYPICRISHIGSTAVEGLIAKPIVDILLELPPGYNLKAVADTLENNGWILMARNHREETLDLNKGYTPQGFAEKVFHLHIKPYGDWGELYFRDYLREHSGVARLYEALKLSLKERYECNRDGYTEAKSDFVKEYTEKGRRAFKGRYLPGPEG